MQKILKNTFKRRVKSADCIHVYSDGSTAKEDAAKSGSGWVIFDPNKIGPPTTGWKTIPVDSAQPKSEKTLKAEFTALTSALSNMYNPDKKLLSIYTDNMNVWKTLLDLEKNRELSFTPELQTPEILGVIEELKEQLQGNHMRGITLINSQTDPADIKPEQAWLMTQAHNLSAMASGSKNIKLFFDLPLPGHSYNQDALETGAETPIQWPPKGITHNY